MHVLVEKKGTLGLCKIYRFFGRMAIFTVIILKLNEHGRSLYLLLSSVSFLSISEYIAQLFHSFSILISKFIEVVVNGNVSLISLLGYLSLENRNAAGFEE